MVSIYDIVYDYMDLFFKGVKLTKEEKKTIHSHIRKLLNKGWHSSDIYAVFHKKKRTKPTLNVSRLFQKEKKRRINILTYGKFYYHSQLRITTPPPKRELDYDSGEIKVINEPYFLEMKASYSVEELVEYYGKQVGMKLLSHEINRYKGSFNWLLKTYTLEEILYMIDATVNMCLAEDLPMPNSPLDIQKYIREARDIRNEKITETIQSGGKRIVRKKRIRSS